MARFITSFSQGILVFSSIIDLQLSLCKTDSSPSVFADELLAHFKCFIQDRDFPLIINLSDEVYLPLG
ncbi:MAG: hypothetical protein N2V78_12160, partial [Methanophagales archaeon]|nr:hypothetical protein [Methanophagales archaeon]